MAGDIAVALHISLAATIPASSLGRLCCDMLEEAARTLGPQAQKGAWRLPAEGRYHQVYYMPSRRSASGLDARRIHKRGQQQSHFAAATRPFKNRSAVRMQESS